MKKLSRRIGNKSDLGKENHVWYVAYGSNMLLERFLCYINGGKFRNIGRGNNPCADKTPSSAKMIQEIPYRMYYGNRSGSWEDMGVSFLDATAPGKAYGVAYLVSREQFEHIYREENGGSEPRPESTWYNMKLSLGSFDGIPMMTVTNSRVVEKNHPSKKYLDVLAEGLRENFTYLSEASIREYVESRN